jgi:hypothetical protein
MASETGAPPAEIRARLRAAREWYEKSRNVFVSLREQGRLGPPERAELANTEEKISELDRELAGR